MKVSDDRLCEMVDEYDMEDDVEAVCLELQVARAEIDRKDAEMAKILEIVKRLWGGNYPEHIIALGEINVVVQAGLNPKVGR